MIRPATRADSDALMALAEAGALFTDGVWNLYLLAVDPARQGGGRGAALVRYVEEAVTAESARILLIETSGLDRFERTRTFYRTCAYEEEARVRDYYGPGDDKVIFWKSMAV